MALVTYSEQDRIQKAILLTESMATHKARCARKVMGIPVKSVQVDRREPNHLVGTLGLIFAKHAAFMDGWQPSRAWLEGAEIVGVADVNAGSQIQGDRHYVDERKIQVEVGGYGERIDQLSGLVAGRARQFGRSDVVTRIENGIVFERRGSHAVHRSAVVTRGYVTTPENSLRDRQFVHDYLLWTGMGETHFNLPWGRDQLSWLTWIIMNRRIGDYSPRELVRLPKAVKRHTAQPKWSDFEVFQEMGRFDANWLKYVDPRPALALLQLGANFTEGAAVALLGSLSHQNIGERVIFQQ